MMKRNKYGRETSWFFDVRLKETERALTRQLSSIQAFHGFWMPRMTSLDVCVCSGRLQAVVNALVVQSKWCNGNGLR